MLLVGLIVSVSLCVILLVLLILCYIKYRGVVKKYNDAQADWLYAKNKCSMLESKFRSYIEKGTNPFTVLRDIGELIYAGYTPPHNGDK